MIVIAALFMIVFLALLALMIDLGYFFAVKSRMQSAADAASLAGALRLRDDNAGFGDVSAAAIEFAELNQPGVSGILKSSGIQIGEWDDITHSFYPGADHANAVRVTIRRGSDGTAGITAFFGNALGFHTAKADVTSTAAFEVYEDNDDNDYKTMPRIVQ